MVKFSSQLYRKCPEKSTRKERFRRTMKSAPVTTVNSTSNRNRVCAGSRGKLKTKDDGGSSDIRWWKTRTKRKPGFQQYVNA
ncbi:hypothetical protein pipiens_002633 [Culex pipiens pipiens]|uniref:Uncharacterized protein n=1 Tax=Culex pipiens pipiens TaxID=38569 RepID=A0ABD1DC52_CULPP